MKNLKKKNINKRSNGYFYRKVFTLTAIFSIGIYFLNITPSQNFMTDISQFGKGLLSQQEVLDNIDDIEDTSAIWPFREVTDRGNVSNYNAKINTNWEDLEDDKRTPFPTELSDIIERYRFVSPYNIYSNITNPLERQKVIFYKRLITTTWTASYSCNSNNCDWWVPDTGTHAGIDIVSSPGTPVYNSMNGIVMRAQEGNHGFGNYVIVLTNFSGKLLASFYAHLKEIDSNINKGDIIQRGEQIGTVGSSGQGTTPHLHFQINTLGDTSDIEDINIAQDLWDEWQNGSIEGVRNSTIDPISFVEENLTTVGDDLRQPEEYEQDEDISEDEVDLLDQIAAELEDEYPEDTQEDDATEDTQEDDATEDTQEDDATEDTQEDDTSHAAAKEEFAIVDVKNPKIDDNLTLGDRVKFTIITEGEKGNITISSNNNVLEPEKHTIEAKEDKNEYEIEINAENIGNGRVIFSDGNKNKDFYFSVYEDQEEIFGLGIEGADKIYTSSKEEFNIYPINSLGNPARYNLNGNIKINLLDLENNNEYELLDKDVSKDDNSFSFDIKAPRIREYRLRVRYEDEDLNISANKTLDSELFYDFSKEDEYGRSITYLNESNIVQGSQGLLMPNNDIIRAELITILIRHEYGDDIDKFEQKMNSYMKDNGNFFEDISGEEWYAPYIFMAYKDGIIKGAGGTHANPNDATQKDELIAMYARFFEIKKDDIFPSFIDVSKQDWFVEYVTAAKNYNLYPFESNEYLNPGKKVDRLTAFESLYRYIKQGPDIEEVRTQRTEEDELEEAMRTLINF